MYTFVTELYKMKLMSFPKFIITFLFIVYSHSLIGQVKVGAKIGYLSSHTAKDLKTDVSNGVVGGITTSYELNENFCLNGEVLYSTRGYSAKESVLSDNVLKDVKVKFQYIDIPILLEYRISSFFSIEAGPFVGLQLKRELYYNQERMNDNLFGKRQIFDSGVLIGIRGFIDNLFLEAQYQHGFTQAFREVDHFTTTGVSISIGYLFDFK